MSQHTQLDQATTMFQIVVNNRPENIVSTYQDAMRQIGLRLAGSREAFKEWHSNGEFPGMDTAELSGSLNHRIRWELLRKPYGDFYYINQHLVTNGLEDQTLVRTVVLDKEFDPGFELQAALNCVALGMESAPTAGAKLEAILKSHLRTARDCGNDANVIENIREVHARMGGHDFLGNYEGNGEEVLDWLPSIARERFNELVEKLQPAQGMTM